MGRITKVFLGLLLIMLMLFSPRDILSDELDDLEQTWQQIQKEIDKTREEKQKAKEELEQTQKKQTQLQGSLNALSWNLTSAQNNLTETLLMIDQKQTEIAQATAQIRKLQEEVVLQKSQLTEVVRSFFMTKEADPLTLFLLEPSFTKGSLGFVYRQAVMGDYKKRIEELGFAIGTMGEQKQALENQKEEFLAQKVQLALKKEGLETSIVDTQKQISAAQSQQSQLQQALVGLDQQLGSLTQKEREILAAKAAAALATTTVGNIEVSAATIEKSPPPDGNLYFSFWTYGYPHRVGMNQYGAYGRAKAGFNFEQILKTYYNGVEIKKILMPDKIKLSQNGIGQEIDFENDYLMGIAEMPSCWGEPEKGGFEALKAQAVAARSYALNYTQGGQKAICTDQRCQVYIGKSKIEGLCGMYWRKAVEETKGVVITYNNEPITAWYASTAGGFTLSSQEVWGSYRPYAQGIVDFADPNNLDSAFDGPQYGNSPWYHKAWGHEPWLSLEQTQDLLNSALLPNEYNDHLPEPVKGGLTPEEVVKTLRENGIEPIEDLRSIEAFGSATKATTKLRVYYGEELKSVEIEAKRFRFVYNLRSPSTNAIWTSRFDVVTNR